MSQLMGLVESTKITLDNREDLVVDLSTKLVEKDLQVEQMANHIQELEDQVEAMENTIEVLEDQLQNTQQQLEEANQLLDLHHQEIEDMEAEGTNEDVDIEERSQSPHPVWTLLAQEDHLPPSLALPRLLIKFQG
jgi:chromosome segregation ATPase